MVIYDSSRQMGEHQGQEDLLCMFKAYGNVQ